MPAGCLTTGHHGGGPSDATSDSRTGPDDCAKRLDSLFDRSFGDLQFLANEFSKLEVVVAPELETAETPGSKLGKLRFFTSHVRRTMARMQAARSGQDPLSMPQLILLEDHIATSIAPVKDRLVSQLNRGAGSSGSLAALAVGSGDAARDRSGSTTSSSASSGGGGGGGGTRHQVSVTDGEEEEGRQSPSRSSSVSSGMGMDGGYGGGSSLSSQDDAGGGDIGSGGGGSEAGGLLIGGGGRKDEWSVGMELNDEAFGGGGSVSLALSSPAPSFSSPGPSSPTLHSCVTPASGASLSHLCWSGGVDVVEGGGARVPPLPEQSQYRRDHLDMLRQLEAEGVFAADDSYSPCGGGGGHRGIGTNLLGGVAFSPLMTIPGEGRPSSSFSDAGGERGGRGGDLSPIPLRPAVKQEGREGGASLGAPPSALPPRSGVKQELSDAKPLVDGGGSGGGGGGVFAPPKATAAGSCGSGATVVPMAAGSAAVAHTVAAASSSGRLAAEAPDLEEPRAPRPLVRPKCEPVPASTTRPATPAAEAGSPSAGPAAAAAAGASSIGVCGKRATAGEPRAAKAVAVATAGGGAPITPVSASAGDDAALTAVVRATTSSAATAPSPLPAAASGTSRAPPPAQTNKRLPSAAEGGNGRGWGAGDMLLVPPRPAKRRRSSPILPASLLQPREVRYQCGACNQSYASTVSGNPWWLLVRQECPACHKMQIPRVDILNPTNNVEGHIAFLTETGSDGDCSYMDWDGETSDDNSGDEYSGDERDALGSSIGTGGGANGGGLGAGEAGSSSSGSGSGSGGGGGASRNGGLGPSLDSEQAAKLLVLMCHARTCPGDHRSPRLAEVCQSVKFLMLHLRDCDGRTRSGQPCPMPWCQPCMSLLHHLIQCPESEGCQVCNPVHLPSPLRDLRALNHSSSTVSTAEQPPPPPVPPRPPPPQPQPRPQAPQKQHQQSPPQELLCGTRKSGLQQSHACPTSPSASASAAAAVTVAVAAAPPSATTAAAVAVAAAAPGAEKQEQPPPPPGRASR